MFYAVWSFYVIYRIAEMIFSKNNEKKNPNRHEVGSQQKKWMMGLHISWYIALIVEYKITHQLFTLSTINLVLIGALGIAAILRTLTMLALGDKWSTKVYLIEQNEVIETGIYRYFKHPNYFAVILEIAAVPLLFKLYTTAIVFSILNGIFLSYRISLENKVLAGELS